MFGRGINKWPAVGMSSPAFTGSEVVTINKLHKCPGQGPKVPPEASAPTTAPGYLTSRSLPFLLRTPFSHQPLASWSPYCSSAFLGRVLLGLSLSVSGTLWPSKELLKQNSGSRGEQDTKEGDQIHGKVCLVSSRSRGQAADKVPWILKQLVGGRRGSQVARPARQANPLRRSDCIPTSHWLLR